MEQRNLGNTGLTVSALGFGCGSVGGLIVRGEPAERERAVARALEAGVTYFDTAPGYGDGRSEENLGQVLRTLGAWSRVTVGTKVRLTSSELQEPAAAVRRSVEASLRRLGRDHVALLQMHNALMDAVGAGGDGLPPDVVDEVADEMQRLRQEGAVRHFGLTGLGDAGALRGAVSSGRFHTVQSYFNVLNPSAGFAGATGGGADFEGLIDAAAGAGLGVIVIRALAAGALSGEAERHANAGGAGRALAGGGEYAADIERARALTTLAAQAGLEGPLELGLRFVLHKTGVSTVLAGFSDTAQLESALRWVERGRLADDLVRRIVDDARAVAGAAPKEGVGE